MVLAIAGFAMDGNKWDGLYVGRRKGADLVYAGQVDLGFDRESAKLLRARLTLLIRKTQPIASVSPIAASGSSPSCSRRSSTEQVRGGQGASPFL